MNHALGASTASISRKRKDREDLSISRVKQVQAHPSNPNTTPLKQKPPEQGRSNRLLAGYLAHEFLTQGTLLGQTFDPARVEAVPLSAPADLKKKPGPPPAASRSNGGFLSVGGAGSTPATVQQKKGYAEVAHLLKTDGAHIPGIVNPTQLARWTQI